MKDEKMAKRVKLAGVAYLKRRDYQVLETDWTCKAGSFDIVAKDDDTLVFVEVQSITDAQEFDKEFTSEEKQERRTYAERVSIQYLIAHTDITDAPIRFDVMQVLNLDGDRCMIKHHVNAFGVA